MRKALLLSFLLLYAHCLLAVSRVDSIPRISALSFRFSGLGGVIMPDGKVDTWIDRPVIGGEMAVEFQPTGKWKALQEWNNASVGVGLTFLNLGNDKMLGNAVALHAHLSTPFYRSKHFVIGIRPTVGVAFCTKTYQNTFPDPAHLYEYIKDPTTGQVVANYSIGRVTNAYLAVELFMDFPIRRGFDITFSGGWHHISNGSIERPNSGYNIFGAELGLRYQPGLDEQWIVGKQGRKAYTRPQVIKPKVLNEVDKKWDVELSITGGARQNYYRDNYPTKQFWGVATVQIAAHWIPVNIFKVGLGIDGFYDGYFASINARFAPENYSGSITYFGKTYLKHSDITNCFRVGISLQPEFIVGKLTAGIHVGFYVFDPIKNLEPFAQAQAADEAGTKLNRGIFYSYDFTKSANFQDGWCYMQFVLKYRVLQHMFVQLGLKSHGIRAEFIDAGLGVCF